MRRTLLRMRKTLLRMRKTLLRMHGHAFLHITSLIKTTESAEIIEEFANRISGRLTQRHSKFVDTRSTNLKTQFALDLYVDGHPYSVDF